MRWPHSSPMPWNAPLPPSLSFNAHLRSSRGPCSFTFVLGRESRQHHLPPPPPYSTLPFHFSPSFYLPTYLPLPRSYALIFERTFRSTPAKFSNRFEPTIPFVVSDFCEFLPLGGIVTFPILFSFHAFIFISFDPFDQNVNRTGYYYYIFMKFLRRVSFLF